MSISPTCRKASWRQLSAVARPSRSRGGSPTCIIRGSNAGCIELTFRLYCYGARRTASSRRPMARAGVKRYQEPGSRSFHRPAISLTGNSPKHSPSAFRPLSTKAASKERPMRVWYFSEMAYHPAWEQGLKGGSLRVVLPNRNFDPKVGHGLLNRYLDEFALCDEVGLDIMVNEHHSTSTCLTVSVPMALAIIARETKRARLLSLGTPIANRPDPGRVAEERAWLGVLSRGRLWGGAGQGRAIRDGASQQHPRQSDAALLGSARPDPQSAVDDRRSVQLGGR